MKEKVHLRLTTKSEPVGYSGIFVPVKHNIIKFFMTEIEARAYIDGCKQIAHLCGAVLLDVMDEERRKQWCNTQQ